MNKIYGYCRISTPKQNIERQIRNILREYPDAIIVQETFTGTHHQGRKLNIRKKIPIQKLILKHSRTFGGSNSDKEVMAIINSSSFTPEGHLRYIKLHVSNNTYYKYERELKFSIT